MKLTPFGFVSRYEEFVKEALSLPPVGGGKWATRRLVNLVDHSSSLHVSITPEGGVEKTALILNSRHTGGERDGGIQGWAEYPSSEEREAFILREADADHAMEEIFDIVKKTLTRLPEWDQSVLPPRPKPAPRIFEPLIPAIQKNDSAFAAAGEAVDSQPVGVAMLSPDSFDHPPAAAAGDIPEPPAVEEPALEPAAAEDSTKKTAKGKKTKA
jgi:hypothetical protein